MLKSLMDYCPDALPMHMPGHKRRWQLAEYLNVLGAQIDITEIDGFDDLHNPEGLILASQQAAARLFGSRRSTFLVGGSTCGLLAAIYALGMGGKRAVIARNAHKSVYHALEVTGVRPRFIMPEMDEETGMFLSVSPEEIERALLETPGAAFVLITSPTYEGVISDVGRIAHLAHSHGAKLIVDAAHGAHLGLFDEFPAGAVEAGADIVIQSLHKTLPSLTQTAIAHTSLLEEEERAFQHALDIFETSSPSYLLMASIDGCVKLLAERGKEIIGGWKQALDAFYAETQMLEKLRILRPAGTGVFTHDPSKILIGAGESGLTGVEIMKKLRMDHKIELECAFERYAIAMTGAGDTMETMKRLSKALMQMDLEAPGGERIPNLQKLSLPEAGLSPMQALSAKSGLVPMERAAGRISAEYAWAYPPGIPLIAPGEIFTKEIICRLQALRNAGVKTVSTSGCEDGFLVVSEK